MRQSFQTISFKVKDR